MFIVTPSYLPTCVPQTRSKVVAASANTVTSAAVNADVPTALQVITLNRIRLVFIFQMQSVCHSERPTGAKNLDCLPEFSFENEILRRRAEALLLRMTCF